MRFTRAWSYSALNAYETCPKRYQLTRVTKQAHEKQTEATIWGNRVHKALEEFAKGKKALPEELKQYQKYVEKILSYEGKKVIEEKMAINNSFKPTKWFAKDVWCRGIIDIGVVGSEKAYLLDWKTGKRRPDSDQLKLFAALAFAHYPWIEKVVTGFIWLKEGKFDKESFTKDQVTDIWNDFFPRLERLEYSFEDDKWIPKPSGLCKNWCPVGKSLCEYCGV